MIQYNSNISIIIRGFRNKLVDLAQDPDPMLRTVALTVLPEMKKRIHVDGRDSNGNQIGTYSPEYMKVRTGDFANSDRFKKGKSKGELKNAGTFTDRAITLNKKAGVFTGEDKVGKARPNYHRTADTKVIASLTRQMENDMSVLPSGSGYGIGYNNADNFKKSQYVEATYKKKIFSITTEERELAKQTAQNFLDNFLKS